MPFSPDLFFLQAAQYAKNMLEEMSTHHLLSSVIEIDHICYRVETVERYEELKKALGDHGALLSEAWVNGRPIAAFSLQIPITVSAQFSIPVIELPAPKPGRTYSEGFEHIEAVIPEALPVFVAQNHPLPFDTNNIRHPINADVSVQFSSGLVKFHNQNLARIIEIENLEQKKRARPWVAIIDFDDTLVASKQPFLLAMHVSLESFLGRKLSWQEVVDGARPTFPGFLGQFGISGTSAINQAIECFQRHWPSYAAEVTVPVGIESMLSCLKSEGIAIHIWTARDQMSVNVTIQDFGWSKFIAAVHAFDAASPSKPDPSRALYGLCASSHAILIGDTEVDQRAALNLGIPFIQAGWIHKKSLPLPAPVVASTPLAGLGAVIDHLSK